MPTIRECEDNLFAKWREGRTSFSPDGLADENAYRASKTRIVLLMKEVNDPDESDFDLRDFVKDGGRPQTFDMVTRWISAVRALETDPNDPLPWTDYETVKESDRKRWLTE